MGIEATFALMAATYLVLRGVQAIRDSDFGKQASDRDVVFALVIGAIAIVVIVIAIMGAYHIYDLPGGIGGGEDGFNGDDFGNDDFGDEDDDFF
jgi:hypothetical protein